MRDALPAAIPVTTLECLGMSFYAHRSAKVTLIARAAGQATFKCPESVSALAATSPHRNPFFVPSPYTSSLQS
eukprot:6181491-Pleurochrysis_carterae.AAC.1